MSDAPEQGHAAGRHWPAEVEAYDDPETGQRVRRLTGYPGATNKHCYFTDDGWFDGGRRLLFRSDRDGRWNVYSVDLESGLITQHTDLPDCGRPSLDQAAGTAYFWVEDHLVGLDLDRSTVTDSLYEVPEGYVGDSLDVAADGSAVYLAICEELPDGVDPRDGDPHVQIRRVPVDGGDPEVLHEEAYYASSHVNASPTRPELLTVCHEGAWDEVDHRIWGLNAETGEVWRIRECDADEAVGHEYWLADGEHVGYHGWSGGRSDPDPFFGTVRYDDTDRREAPMPPRRTHTHANRRDRVFCDGSDRPRIPFVLAFQYDSDRGAYRDPRKLVTTEWDPDAPHPHSRLSPDGSTLAFDGAMHGEPCDVYLVDVPDDLSTLPRYEGPWVGRDEPQA